LKVESIETSRYPHIAQPLKVIFIIMTVFGIALAIFHLFTFTIMGQAMLDTAYFFAIFALFLACGFLVLPGRKKDRNRVPWYDMVLAALAFTIPFFWFFNAWEIDMIGWAPPKTLLQFVPALVFVLLALEGGRRVAGTPFLMVCVVAASYPLVADNLPWLFWGKSFPFDWTITLFTFSPMGMIGLPGKIMGNLLIGFLFFAGVLIATGAGDFFLSLAAGLLGKYRGGPAKVAVVASGFFGSLSGSAGANIVSTGSFTIPAMKRIGYPAHYAGAIEACASTGGLLMPPVMGSLGFVMAAVLNIEYATVMISAAIPAILYYFGLLMGVDGYAARTGLKGLPQEEIPSLKQTLKEGWPFLFVLVFLVWGLVYMRWEMRAPFFAAALMIPLSFCSKKTKLTPQKVIGAIVTVGRLLAMAMAVILPLGIIIAGLTVTGSILSLTTAMITLGADNVFLILCLGMIASYVMGMAGLGLPAYIFLAVTMAPAVVQIGQLNEIGVHLFMVYFSLLSMITLPVAAGAFLAGTMAGANLMQTALTAMRLGIVIYFIPFFFVYNPALVLQGGSVIETLYLFALCLIGIALIAAGTEGYLLKVGNLRMWLRPLIAVGGFLIALPGWETTIIGAIMAAVVIFIAWTTRVAAKEPGTALSSGT